MATLPNLHLVSDARPLEWEQLSVFEQELLTIHVDRWLRDVMKDARLHRAPREQLESDRRGRVLFIDGPRGAGKTSFLYTMLKLWTQWFVDGEAGQHTLEDEDGQPKNRPRPVRGLQPLSPVLDFDPLPQGMPLHAWLLEPWRRLLDDPKSGLATGPEDLSEKFAELFELAVLGWTPARAESGVVQKALAYREQASGWIDTQTKWWKFVDAVVCGSVGCTNTHCKGGHERLFVIAIDDVDLQVEQIPQLLHAIRLLRHPHVVYVLTGDYDHLAFAVRLDYLARHTRLSTVQCHGPVSTADVAGINLHSNKLRDALLSKAIPEHARLRLPHLTLAEVMRLRPSEQTAAISPQHEAWDRLWEERPKDTSSNAMSTATAIEASRLALARPLHFVTARHAQHAADRAYLQLEPSATLDGRHIAFVADLCRTTSDEDRFMLSGRLTTKCGTTLRVWPGSKLRVVLSGQPTINFEPEFRVDDRCGGDEAHGAFLIQLLTEARADISAGGLQWNPSEGILRTEVVFSRRAVGLTQGAVFHWPWLARIPARKLHELGPLSNSIAALAAGFGANDVNTNMLMAWLNTNIQWLRAVRVEASTLPKPETSVMTLESFATELALLRTHCKGAPEIVNDIDDWVRDLYVMATPYFGLSMKMSNDLVSALNAPKIDEWLSTTERSAAQVNAIRDAIYNPDIADDRYDSLIEEFYAERLKMKESGSFWIDLATAR